MVRHHASDDIMPNLHALMHKVESVLRIAYGKEGWRTAHLRSVVVRIDLLFDAIAGALHEKAIRCGKDGGRNTAFAGACGRRPGRAAVAVVKTRRA